MDFGIQDPLWPMDGIDWSSQQQQQLDTVQEHVPTQFGSLPVQHSKLGHYSPNPYNPAAPQPSPISSGSMSSGNHGSIGYTSSSFGSVSDPVQMNFPIVRPRTNVPARGNLAFKLEQYQDTTGNTIMSPNQLVASPVLTDSPHITGSFNPANQFRHTHAPYGSLPNVGMRFDQDVQISQLLDTMVAMSPGPNSMSLSSDWFGNHTGSIGSPHMSTSTGSGPGRHVRHSSISSSGPRSPYARGTLPPFTPMTEAPPVVSTSAGALESYSAPPSMGRGFSLEQLPAAQRILEFIRTNPKTAIPATYITSELVEISEGRGWCLIGNCGQARAAQKLNPEYDPTKDSATRKRVDHLYDHIRDKHFDCRPFGCGQCGRTFSRDHDLKRHESVHAPNSFSCGYCPRAYTREDNLKRHVGQRHPGMPTQTMPTQAMAIRHSVQ